MAPVGGQLLDRLVEPPDRRVGAGQAGKGIVLRVAGRQLGDQPELSAGDAGDLRAAAPEPDGRLTSIRSTAGRSRRRMMSKG